jgi:hypothetical protein
MSTESLSPGTHGKKVFFIYPNSVIQSDMVAELVKGEYEVYLVKDWNKAVTLFRRYPDSVVFINIDDGQEEEQWEEYVGMLQADPDLEGLQIGVLTYNEDPALTEKYLMEMAVSGGFVKLSLGLKESTALVLKVLEANEARGRRHFLRVKCGDKYSTLNAVVNGKTLTGTVQDLSYAGMACTLEPEPGLVAHSLVESIQLKLKGILVLVSGIVMGTRPEGEKLVYVILFTQKTQPKDRDKIRTFMQWSLQNHIEAELEAIP